MIHQLLVVSLILFSAALLVSDELNPIRQWKGVHPDLALKDLCPDNQPIVDPVQLKKIWQAWRPDDAIPKINFKTDMILVATAHGPNQVLINGLRNDDGDLKFTTGSTRMAGPGFGYTMMQIPRAGIKTVNGVSISPDKNVNPQVDESIQVTVTGLITTGVMAIGGESTGTTIVANNITWELDLRGDEQLPAIAEKVGDSLAVVRGTLRKQQGVEIRERWIVTVDSIAPLKDRGPAVESIIRHGFETIKIDKTGGFAGVNDTLTISGDGEVENNKQRQRVTETWDMPLTKLNELHQLVVKTDWSSIPAESREPNFADAFQYEITIEALNKKKYQFSIDEPSIQNQPAIKQLFELIRK